LIFDAKLRFAQPFLTKFKMTIYWPLKPQELTLAGKVASLVAHLVSKKTPLLKKKLIY